MLAVAFSTDSFMTTNHHQPLELCTYMRWSHLLHTSPLKRTVADAKLVKSDPSTILQDSYKGKLHDSKLPAGS